MEEEPKKKGIVSELDLELLKKTRERNKLYSDVRWYAVYVQPLHEFQINDYLLGIEDQTKKIRRGKSKREDLFVKVDPAKVKMECFLPVIRQRIKYSDRFVWKEKVQTPGLIFVHTSLNDRNELYHSPISEYVTGFLCDRDRHRPLPIPDDQMMAFRAAIESEYAVSIAPPSFTVGQKVLILDGPLKGHIAELVSTRESINTKEFETDPWGKTVLDSEGNPVPKHKTIICFRLNSQLAAKFEIDADKVVPAPANARDYEEQD